MHDDVARILVDSDTLQRRIAELGAMISSDYSGDSRPILVCVLKGAYMFLSDLTRHVAIPHEVDFMATSTYGGGLDSRGVVRLVLDLKANIVSRHVLLALGRRGTPRKGRNMRVGGERVPRTRRHQSCIATEVPKGDNPYLYIRRFEMLREGHWIRAQPGKVQAFHEHELEGARRGHPGNRGRLPKVGIVGSLRQEPDEEVAEVAITLPAIYGLSVRHRLPVAQNC